VHVQSSIAPQMMEDGGWRDFMIGWGLGEYVAKFEGKY